MATLRGVPGGGQLWLVTDANGNGLAYQLVYEIPGTGRFMAWTISSPEELEAITGTQSPVADRSIVHEDLYRQGVLQFGISRELANTDEHPFDGWAANFEKEAQIRPWLRDPEMLALAAMATLEGRTPTEAEVATTQWHQSRNETQRKWAGLVASDPQTARQIQADNRLKVSDMLRKAGISGVGQSAQELMADRWTSGDWSDVFIEDQIRRLQNPAFGELDPTLAGALSGTQIKRASEYADDVRTLASRWLGPVYGSWDEATVQSWAGKLATDPTAMDSITEELKRQRLALFPEYTNPELDYESIAQPWRGVVSNIWGEVADEKGAIFERILKMNDRAGAEQLLRQEGMRNGNKKVTQDSMLAMADAFGGAAPRKAI